MKKKLFVFILAFASLCGCTKELEQIMTSSTIKVSNQNVKNGDTIDLTTNVKASINGKAVLFTVVYYCDDNEIGTSKDSTNNYLLQYLVKDLSIGSHKLKSMASYKSGNYSASTTATTTMNVIE